MLGFSVLAEENEEFKTLNVTIDEMKIFAENNPCVEAAFPGYTEPFEGTLSINVPNDKITMKVGEQLDLEVTEAKGYAPAFYFSFVQVRIDDFKLSYFNRECLVC